MDVRTHARNVRSFAEWSLKFLIILSANMNPRNGTINIKRIDVSTRSFSGRPDHAVRQ
jgi:hypothetical protein